MVINKRSLAKSEFGKERHLKNKMPKNASEEERAKWHKAHLKNCACYPLSENINKLLAKYEKAI